MPKIMIVKSVSNWETGMLNQVFPATFEGWIDVTEEEYRDLRDYSFKLNSMHSNVYYHIIAKVEVEEAKTILDKIKKIKKEYEEETMKRQQEVEKRAEARKARELAKAKKLLEESGINVQ